MPTELRAPKAIVRALPVYERGEQLSVKMTAEGLYFRWGRQRWASALFLPWMMAHNRAAWRYAEEQKKERAARRKQRRLA